MAACTWLVTGASRGLGRALCRALVRQGDRVFGAARDAAALASLRSECGAQFEAWPMDLGNAAGLGQALSADPARVAAVDGLIHNAGIGWYRPFLEHATADLQDILQVNLGAAMQLCHALLPGMLQRGGGQILFIGSDLARRPLAKMAPYVASKHGLAGFAHSLLREFRPHGIRVSLINPGMIDTGFGGAVPGQGDGHRLLDPDVLAELIVQLLRQPAGVLVDELSVHPMGQAEF